MGYKLSGVSTSNFLYLSCHCAYDAIYVFAVAYVCVSQNVYSLLANIPIGLVGRVGESMKPLVHART